MLSSIYLPLLRGALLVIPIILTTTTALSNEDSYAPQTDNNNDDHNHDFSFDTQSRNVMQQANHANGIGFPSPSPVIVAQHVAPLKQQNLWNQNEINQQSGVQRTKTWYSPNSESINLSQPMLNQDDARKLEEYMINYARYSDGQQGNSLNLANLNSRPLLGVKPMFASSATASPFQIVQPPPPPPPPPLVLGESVSPLRRSEQIQIGTEKEMARKGRVDDVVKFNGNNKYILPRRSGVAKKLVQDHLVQTLPPGCIGRAAPYTSKCEDHLIKRLSQDATEGRTVIDVSRRVCCALFYHKDCISRVVVELCPDSNPKAADLLLGSRNLDLTMSCQRFNRDGCNGSSTLHYSLINQSILLAVAIVITIRFCR